MLEKLGIDGIYVVHVKKGYEKQEEHVEKLFKKNDMNFQFITDGDPSVFTTELLNKYFTPTIKEVMRDGAISCTLNHIFSYERIVANNNKYALVFENDPFFLGNFPEKIAKIIKEADTLKPGFVISLENTSLEFPSFRKIKKQKFLYEALASRCAGAYLMDLQAAKNILEHLQMNKCHAVIDWWLNSLIDNNIIKMYWAHPPLTEQGSHNGKMSSTLSTKNKNGIRRFRWEYQKFYKTYIRRLFK